MTEQRPDPIAIIGIGCRFPGASGPTDFWRLLVEGGDAIREVPPERFDVDAVYDPRPGIPGKLVSRWGGFIEDIDRFDPYFFGISPREATHMDPQQRLALEVAWEALEDAGIARERVDGSATGVFMGCCTTDYLDLCIHDDSRAGASSIYTTTGNAASVIAGRVSFAFNLRGPSIAVDAACASSLAAVHLACQSIWTGACAMALAGGTNAVLMPEKSMGFSQAAMLARDGRCKFGDAGGDGFVRSDGVGVVALKPLARAQADGDPVYAVIRGGALNNDGQGSGTLMTPSREGQEAVLRAAYRHAGVRPGRVGYVEAHGTGTVAGDPVELAALGAVLGEGRAADRPCLVGSVKTNIGHTEGAAGVAGLIKAALALKHRTVPPSLHLRTPNPAVPWDALPLRLVTETTPWPDDPDAGEAAYAGVSSFGISGANAHMVLQAAPEAPAPAHPAAADGPRILPLSARSREALLALAEAHAEALSGGGPGTPTPDFSDWCYTASVRRTRHEHRLIVVAASGGGAAVALRAAATGAGGTNIRWGRTGDARAPLVWVFPGHGAQWAGMGRGPVAREPAFQDGLRRGDEAMRPYLGWSVAERLATLTEQDLEAIDVAGPLIFALQVALAALWRSWGLAPDAVVGHSMGEAAAAYVAGALDLADAARVVCLRSRLLARTAGQGTMVMVDLPAEEARHALAGHEGRLSIGAVNSPATTVIAGDHASLSSFTHELDLHEVFWRPVSIGFASHSPLMDPLLGELADLLADLRPRTPTVPFLSTVQGSEGRTPTLDAAYWARNLRQPVQFAATVARLAASGHDTFLEISAHPILLGAIGQSLARLDRTGLLLPSLRRDDSRGALLDSLDALYTLGHDVTWDALFPDGGRCVALPRYPWQRERFWRQPAGAASWRSDAGAHPLLHHFTPSATSPDTYTWETELHDLSFPFLTDHRIDDVVVMPAAAYVEMALAAAEQAYGPGPYALEDVRFERALFLPADQPHRLQLVVARQPGRAASFRLFSRSVSGAADREWTLHTLGLVHPTPSLEAPASVDLDTIRARCVEVRDPQAAYDASSAFRFGPSMRGGVASWRREGEALGAWRLPPIIAAETGRYGLHPALLDGLFQLWPDAAPAALLGDGARVPIRIGQLRLLAAIPLDQELWAHVIFRSGVEGGRLLFDAYLYDDHGTPLVEVRDLLVAPLEGGRSTAGATRVDDWFYEPRWESMPLAERSDDYPDDGRRQTTSPGGWLIFADGAGVGETLAAALRARAERPVLVYPGDPGQALVPLGPDRFSLDPARPEGLVHLLAHASAPAWPPLRGVVHLWSLDAPDPEESAPASERWRMADTLGYGSALLLLQALARHTRVRQPHPPRLWLVTAGAQTPDADDVDAPATGGRPSRLARLSQAPLWGLGRTAQHEHPELGLTLVDLGPRPAAAEIDRLAAELWADDGERQVALRGEARYAARLARAVLATPGEETVLITRRPASQEELSFRLSVETPGALETLALGAEPRRAPGPGEVELRVRAAGLNFRDVLQALGFAAVLVPGAPPPLGKECVGTVVAVGAGVEGLAAGDEVIAVNPADGRGLFRAYATVPAAYALHRPAGLDDAQAATTLIAYLTAHYTLNHVARMERGERVLIHAATGGVGLAAVQLARQAGAEIFATAGSDEKRAYLRALGIAHVFDSRSLDFVDGVRAATGGEGVDIVLNSLAGEFIPAGLSILRPYGRFLEIGRRDIHEDSRLGLAPFASDLSFSAVDLTQLFGARPALAARLCQEVVGGLADGSLPPLPVQVFAVSRAEEAFRHMAQAKHIGRIALSLEEPQSRVAPPPAPPMARADATYLITGGLGGLGLVVASWLVEQGARHLALVGRRAPADETHAAVERLRQAGATVLVAQADVAREEDVARVLARIATDAPPLRGVIHAAGVLDDGIVQRQDRGRFERVLAPKRDGAWNLHTLTEGLPLDFFVLFSSVAGVLGSPGQANYAAANAFLDTLAAYRRARGLPALSINWGPWAEVGMAAGHAQARHLSALGFGSIRPRQGVEALGQALRSGVSQLGVLPLDVAAGRAHAPTVAAQRLMSGLAGEPEAAGAVAGASLREALCAAAPERRAQMLRDYLAERVARVASCAVERLELDRPLTAFGIDSLMAVELRGRIERELGVRLSAVDVLQGPSIERLAATLSARLTGPDIPDAPIAPGPVSVDAPLAPHALRDAPALLANPPAQEQIDALSDDDVDALLDELLRVD